ncbi:PfkB family carbohydrate kinase [Lactococcus garvieae]
MKNGRTLSICWNIYDKRKIVFEAVSIGEPLVVMALQDLDVSLDEAVHFKKYLAGAEFNVALGINRLEHSVGYISKVGSDTFGRVLLPKLRKRLDLIHIIYFMMKIS